MFPICATLQKYLPHPPSPSITAHLLALPADSRRLLFYDPETTAEPHALYADHVGKLVMCADHGPFIESCGLIRLIEPIACDEAAMWLGPWSTPSVFVAEAYEAIVWATATTVGERINANLFAAATPFQL